MKRTVKDLVGLKGKRVLLRVDFNVPIDDAGRILDTTRVKNALPTIKYLRSQGAKIIVLSHLDRPKGYDIRKSLFPIALMLSRTLKGHVYFCNSVIGEQPKMMISYMKEGDVLILENTRFYEEETKCDMAFAREIASLGEVFVNDAFGVAHRENASNFGLGRVLPNAIGLLMEKEITELSKVLQAPKHPFVAILGGAKVETKVKILYKFIEQADVIIIGGAMAYTFLQAKGVPIAESKVYKDMIPVAKEILDYAKANGKEILLPVDHVAIRSTDKKKRPVTVTKLEGDMIGYDIGPKTVKLYRDALEGAGMIFWNGPVGYYENPAFAAGSKALAQTLAKSSAYTIVGGGDTVSAVNKFGLGSKMNFISTGGGACMEFLEKGSLPAIDVIQEKIL